MPKVLPYVYPERMTPQDFDEAQRSFQKPLHSYALIEVGGNDLCTGHTLIEILADRQIASIDTIR